MIKGEWKVFLSALVVVAFVVFTVWAFDYGLSMMNQRSDLKLVLGVLLVVGMVFLWAEVARRLWKEGKECYESAKREHGVRPKPVEGPSAGETKKEG